MIAECSDCKYFALDYDEEPCTSCFDYCKFSRTVDANTEKEIRAEAIKEFVERLKPLHKTLCVDEGDWCYEIERIAKEMVGEQK